MPCTDLKKLLQVALFPMLALPGCADEEEARLDDDAVEIADEPGAAAVDVLDIDGMAIAAPPPGMTVWSERLFADGTMQHVMVHTDLAGVVFVEELDDEEHGAALDLASPAPGPTALSQCDDGAYKHLGWKWNKELQWYFNSGSRPDGMSTDAVEGKLKEGMSNITGSVNSCNFADLVSATHKYLGRKALNVNVSGGGSCTTPDGVNMVGFGDLPVGLLGAACTWSSSGIAVESDIKFNKTEYKWTTDPGSNTCSNRFSIEAVMTHEAGHAFGLGHVSEYTHPALTMSTKISPCQNGESALARGDVLGLRARY